MNTLWTDAGYCSLNKYGEQLCGDRVEIIGRRDDCLTMVLADGLGSGVQANILSTLTSRIICTMMASGMTVEHCADTVMNTLPVCSRRKIAYSTFTIIKINQNSEAEIIQFDNPGVILLRGGKRLDFPVAARNIAGKTVLESKIPIELGDVFITVSDGAVYAGVGRELNFGWRRDNIISFCEDIYDRSLSAKTIAARVVDECGRLYGNMPGDDTTVAAVRIRKRQAVDLLIGPPSDPADAETMMEQFFSRQSKKIVCGGTTSGIAGAYLGKEVRPKLRYVDPSIPPIAEIEGIDLVTEGVITISRVLDCAKEYAESGEASPPWSHREDGASLIARMLLEEATDIRFFVGRAINPAHQNPNLPIHFGIKIRLIEELSQCLSDMGKLVTMTSF